MILTHRIYNRKTHSYIIEVTLVSATGQIYKYNNKGDLIHLKEDEHIIEWCIGYDINGRPVYINDIISINGVTKFIQNFYDIDTDTDFVYVRNGHMETNFFKKGDFVKTIYSNDIYKVVFIEKEFFINKPEKISYILSDENNNLLTKSYMEKELIKINEEN